MGRLTAKQDAFGQAMYDHFQGKAAFEIEYLLVSKDQMKQIVEPTGWRVSRFFDSPRSTYAAVLEKETPR